MRTRAKTHVYRNLNKLPQCLFSVRWKGKVVGHFEEVELANVTFKNPTPRELEKVRTGGPRGTGQRSVCLYAKGDLIDHGPRSFDVYTDHRLWHRLDMDPKRTDKVCFRDTREPVIGCERLIVNESGAWAYRPTF